MELTKSEWNLILEMYALGMGETYEDYSEAEIEVIQTLFHKVANMVNQHG